MWQPNQKNRTQISWFRASPGGNSGELFDQDIYIISFTDLVGCNRSREWIIYLSIEKMADNIEDS